MKKRTLTEEELKEQTRRISIKEGSAYSVMDGFGFKYMTPFALSLGASGTQIGILSTLPLVLGSLSELFTTNAMKNNTRKKIVTTGVFIQAFMWLAMIIIATLFFVFNIDQGFAPILIIITFSILYASSTFAGPAWTSWLKDILPEKYGRFISIRSRMCGAVSIFATLIAGFILDYFGKSKIYYGFVIIFSIAFLGRFISGLLFKSEYEPKYEQPKKIHDGFFHFMKNIWKTNYGHFTIFIAFFSFAVNIASPFFAVYMLKILNFTKAEFGAITIASIISTILFLPAWGKFTDFYGNKKTMSITGILIPFTAFLWFMSSFMVKNHANILFNYLFIVELFSGFIWAGFNLSAGNFIFDAVKREKVASKTAHFDVLNNTGGFLGALLGGFLASISFPILGIVPILFIMLLSAAARMGAYLLLINKVKEVRYVREFTVHEAKERLLHLTPITIVKILS